MGFVIREVIKDSPAAKAGVRPGWTLCAVQRHKVRDALDYYFYAASSDLLLTLRDERNKRITKRLCNEEYEDPGLVFDSYLMDRQRCCNNHCIFCFIDQLPSGLRKSLYFKDDDERLSFLFGNYITLTNIDKKEVRRIRRRKISPINVSIHTMNPSLREQMMRNPKAGRHALRLFRMLCKSGVEINCQLVLCPGVNDGAELIYTLKKLKKYPSIQSIAAVPVGLTKHRNRCYPLTGYTKKQAGEVIDIVEFFHDQEHLPVFAADEFYLLAQREVKSADYYGEFSQLENGVGMLALFKQEAKSAIQEMPVSEEKRTVSVATGLAAYPMIEELLDDLQKKWHNFEYRLYAIENRFFGRSITVAGLLTGTDLLSQLREKPLGTRLFLAEDMLSFDHRYFLDDITPEELSSQLQIPIHFVENRGDVWIHKLIEQSEE